MEYKKMTQRLCIRKNPEVIARIKAENRAAIEAGTFSLSAAINNILWLHTRTPEERKAMQSNISVNQSI